MIWCVIEQLRCVSDHVPLTRGMWKIGVGQGAVLSGFLFNLLINVVAAVMKRVCGCV